MKKQTNDRRYKRTQRQLESALIKLLKTKNINQISVRELSEIADINRATFYLHYKTPNDLLMQLENKLFDIIFTSYKHHDIKNPDDFLILLYKSINDNYELIKVLLNHNAGSTFWNKISSEIKKEYSFLWSSELKSLSQNQIDYYSTFVIDGYIAVIKVWILNGMEESPEEMVHLANRFELKHLKLK